MKRLELMLSMILVGILVTVFTLSGFVLHMYTEVTIPALLKWIIGIGCFLVALYICIRLMVTNSDYKWYHFAFNLTLGTALSFAILLMACTDADMLLSAVFKGTHEDFLRLESVEKTRTSKSKFTGGRAEAYLNNMPLDLKTGRETYFLIRNKRLIKVKIGKSYFNNYYVTSITSTPQEKDSASSEYWKDWWHRHLFIFCLLGLVLLAGLVTWFISWLKGEKGEGGRTVHSSYTKTTYFRNR
ncbi:hypothetical protein KHS38_11405 [Mucilaginibacter sp. Bleaf8]|uniref:hypothetical protein n=1 Tax=Mucilaginibacter sp. Bleaf8 TaxID=2834430 RepID=UPI001BCB1EE5|nr:hypothetical protein [Mucilaginibacter sp. Bleaf8]MBS7565011.1 hypothetical protein [Mucilaginibacter sp. Bleaf8]